MVNISGYDLKTPLISGVISFRRIDFIYYIEIYKLIENNYVVYIYIMPKKSNNQKKKDAEAAGKKPKLTKQQENAGKSSKQKKAEQKARKAAKRNTEKY